MFKTLQGVQIFLVFSSLNALAQEEQKYVFYNFAVQKWIIRPVISYNKSVVGIQASRALEQNFYSGYFNQEVVTYIPLAGPELGVFAQLNNGMGFGYSLATTPLNPYSVMSSGKSQHFDAHYPKWGVLFDAYYHHYDKFFKSQSTSLNIKPFDDAIFKKPPVEEDIINLKTKMWGLEASYYLNQQLEVEKLLRYESILNNWDYAFVVHGQVRQFQMASGENIVPEELRVKDDPTNEIDSFRANMFGPGCGLLVVLPYKEYFFLTKGVWGYSYSQIFTNQDTRNSFAPYGNLFVTAARVMRQSYYGFMGFKSLVSIPTQNFIITNSASNVSIFYGWRI